VEQHATDLWHGLPSAVPTQNTTGKYYFTGRSDGFAPGTSSNPNNARLDPESIRVAKDGKSVFISDEYGPYVYQFDRTTGERIRSFALPGNLAIANQSAVGATEISGNASGRVTNKGMEGLAINASGTKLYGIMQSSLIQDGGDTSAGKTNRIVEIDIASGATKEYAVSNQINGTAYNNSELVSINDNTLAFLPRDGKGLGAGNNAALKQIWAIDLSKATAANDVTNVNYDPAAGTGFFASGKQLLDKTLIGDPLAILLAAGFTAAQIPSKLEGLAFGEDFLGSDGIWYHKLLLGNDNDFVPGTSGDNKIYVFRFTDADLLAKGVTGGLTAQSIASVPEPETFVLALTALAAMGLAARRRRV